MTCECEMRRRVICGVEIVELVDMVCILKAKLIPYRLSFSCVLNRKTLRSKIYRNEEQCYYERRKLRRLALQTNGSDFILMFRSMLRVVKDLINSQRVSVVHYIAYKRYAFAPLIFLLLVAGFANWKYPFYANGDNDRLIDVCVEAET